MAKLALLIGISNYTYLPPLPATQRDAEELHRVLHDPSIGGFNGFSEPLLNPDLETAQHHLAQLFHNRSKNDLVLLYFSGHGIKDENTGNLYFAVPNTPNHGILLPAISASSILEMMNACRARRQIIILDCCFSGAAAAGMMAKAAEVNVAETIKGLLQVSDEAGYQAPVPSPSDLRDLSDELGAEGRAILTSSTSTQVSLADPDLSVYTRYVISGLATGAAEVEDNSRITVRELHRYVAEQVQVAAPRMKPEIFTARQGFDIILAKSPPPTNPELIYRKQVEEYVKKAANFEIIEKWIQECRIGSEIQHDFLDELCKQYSISKKRAEDIELEVLLPYDELLKKKQKYQKSFRKSLDKDYPFEPSTREGLDKFRRLLQLRKEDIESIEREELQRSYNITLAIYKVSLREALQTNTRFEQVRNALQKSPVYLKLEALGKALGVS